MSNLILFDLDHTLINTRQLFEEGFNQRIFELVTQDPVEVRRRLDAYWEQFQHPQEFEWRGYQQHIVSELGLNSEQVTAITEDPEVYQAAVYPEVEMTLAELQSRGYEFGIWSEGDPIFQDLKVKLSGLINEVTQDKIFISRNKIAADVLEMLPEATVVDDRLRVLQPLTNDRWLPIWLNRRQEARPENWQHQPMITSLSELSDFL